jgi:PIN domain nuclease of toxin-antitoxin system
MAEVVLDASAILALVLEEPGAERVEPYVMGGTTSAVNLSEVVAKLRDLGIAEARVDDMIAEMQLDVHAHDLRAALAAGHLRPVTRSAGLSIAGRACLALARALRWPALTADRSWLGVADAVGVRVELIR